MTRLTEDDLRAVEHLAASSRTSHNGLVLPLAMRQALLEIVAYYRAGTHNLRRLDTDDAQPVEKCLKSV